MHVYRAFFIGLMPVLGFVASSNSVQAAKFECKSENGYSPYVLDPSISQMFDHMKYAPLERTGARDFGVFVSKFDEPDDDGDGVLDMMANPDWVAYEMDGVSPVDGKYSEPDISIVRPSDWYKSNGYEFLWTLNNAVASNKHRIDYSYDGIGSVWNRGHLMMADHAQRVSWEASCNTHIFWNAVPQGADMNQGPWLHLEYYAAALSNMSGKVWTIAGPIFYPGQPILTIGDAGEIPVAVPHALFKILVIEGAEGNPMVRALKFDQPSELDDQGHAKPTDSIKATWVKCSAASRKNHVYDHRKQLVTLASIMAETGLTFPQSMVDNAAADGNAVKSLWPVDRAYWSSDACKQQYLP
jgi:hypothetical protein